MRLDPYSEEFTITDRYLLSLLDKDNECRERAIAKACFFFKTSLQGPEHSTSPFA